MPESRGWLRMLLSVAIGAVIPGRAESELRCAIAHRRISRFRVVSQTPEIPRCAIAHLRSGANAPSRNDGAFDAIAWQLIPIAAPAQRSHHTSLRTGGAS